MMRILFWLIGIFSILAYFLSGVLFYGIQNTHDSGPAILYFVPLLIIGILFGVTAELIRRFKGDNFGAVEKTTGLILRILAGTATAVIFFFFFGLF